MKSLTIFLTLVALLGMTACEGLEEVEDALEQAAFSNQNYQLGFDRGKQDGAAGLSRNPDRHGGDYAESTRTDFMRGYQAGYNEGIGQSSARPNYDGMGGSRYGQPLTAINGLGVVTIMEGERKVSVLRTEKPNIEQTRFINEQQNIVVKSRGNHGPAVVQLFNATTGAEEGRLMAYDIGMNSPAWAVGMGD